MARKSPEKAIENEILAYLFHQPNIEAWKYDNVGIFDRKANAFRSRQNTFKPKGFPDIFGYCFKPFMECNLFVPLFIEVKSPVGRLSPEQKEFLEEKKAKGCIAFMARSLEDVMNNEELKHYLVNY